MTMVFVDTWAWVALALSRDKHHTDAKRQHAEFVGIGRAYVTTDYVIGELISRLYRELEASKAAAFVEAVLGASKVGKYRLERVTPSRFEAAWRLRQRYDDKPSISFVDFTSFVTMKDLGIRDVFSGDGHFAQANMGFQLFPQISGR